MSADTNTHSVVDVPSHAATFQQTFIDDLLPYSGPTVIAGDDIEALIDGKTDAKAADIERELLLLQHLLVPKYQLKDQLMKAHHLQKYYWAFVRYTHALCE